MVFFFGRVLSDLEYNQGYLQQIKALQSFKCVFINTSYFIRFKVPKNYEYRTTEYCHISSRHFSRKSQEKTFTYSHFKRSRGPNQPACKNVSLLRLKNLRKITDDFVELNPTTECLLLTNLVNITIIFLKTTDFWAKIWQMNILKQLTGFLIYQDLQKNWGKSLKCDYLVSTCKRNLGLKSKQRQ